jgi:hypothetical protein
VQIEALVLGGEAALGWSTVGGVVTCALLRPKLCERAALHRDRRARIECGGRRRLGRTLFERALVDVAVAP